VIGVSGSDSEPWFTSSSLSGELRLTIGLDKGGCAGVVFFEPKGEEALDGMGDARCDGAGVTGKRSRDASMRVK